MKRLLAVMLCFAVSSAEAETVRDVRSICSFAYENQDEQTSSSDMGFCFGAFTTIMDALHIIDDRGRFELGVCIPKTVDRARLIKMFLAYADQHPEHLDERFGFVAVAALRESFPCREYPPPSTNGHRRRSHTAQGEIR